MDGKRLGKKIVPYRGLKSFEPEHAELFFGRERIVKDIKERLHQSNPLLIIGPSGSGKSSIIRAGLIPRFEDDTWNILPPIKPGSSLLAKLIKTFERFFLEENNSKQLRRLIHSDPEGLCQLENCLPGTSSYLLIIDQFEDVFTLTPKNECQHFIKLLDQFFMQSPARLKLLLAMRADFLELCLQSSALTNLVQTQTVYIPPLEGFELRQIIVEPAEHVDYFIEAGLQEEILKDISQEANCLPLLQFTLLKLWKNSDPYKRFITHAAYLEVGGLLGALNYYADLFFENLSNIEQSLLKKIFLKLVKIGIAKGTRQRQLRKRLLELAEDNQDEQDCIVALLQKLLNEQLLIQEEEDGEIWIDLAHEVLIDKWQLFRDWQQETQRQRQLISPLEDALFNWQKNPSNKNLALPEVLKRIMNDQESLEYLCSLDTSIRNFYRESLEYRRSLISSQIANTQGRGNREQLRKLFLPNSTKVKSASKNVFQEKEEISEFLGQKEILDFPEAKEIVKEHQKYSTIINNAVSVYGDYISFGNKDSYESATIGSNVQRTSKLQEMNRNQACQSTKKDRKLEKGSLIDFAIITAKEIERIAVLEAFEIDESKDRVRKGSRTYWHKYLNLKNGGFYKIIVAQLLDMVNVNAAILTNDALHHWQPAAVLMVGIAATAKPEQHLGSLVIGKEVYYYEISKVTAKSKLPEPKQIPVDATLLDRIQALPNADFPILTDRPDGTNTRPKVEPGVIASGDKVIADAAERDAIAAANRKIMAIEMEGYGVISAAWQSFEQVRCLVIRALCDYADSNKHDQWHAYAAATAAGFTKHFLLDEPLTPRNQSEGTNP